MGLGFGRFFFPIRPDAVPFVIQLRGVKPIPVDFAIETIGRPISLLLWISVW